VGYSWYLRILLGSPKIPSHTAGTSENCLLEFQINPGKGRSFDGRTIGKEDSSLEAGFLRASAAAYCNPVKRGDLTLSLSRRDDALTVN
jgi:hypothetical protein